MAAGPFKYHGRMEHWCKKKQELSINCPESKRDETRIFADDSDDFWKKNFHDNVIKKSKK
jgi:hypothetical protein